MLYVVTDIFGVNLGLEVLLELGVLLVMDQGTSAGILMLWFFIVEIIIQ